MGTAVSASITTSAFGRPALPELLPEDLQTRFPLQMRLTYAFDVGRIDKAVTTRANNTSRVEFRLLFWIED
jgi:hypothetical protein